MHLRMTASRHILRLEGAVNTWVRGIGTIENLGYSLLSVEEVLTIAFNSKEGFKYIC